MTVVSARRLSLATSLALLLLASASPAADPKTFLPDDCHLIVVGKVKEQLTSPAYKELEKVIKNLGLPGQSEDQVKDVMGLDPLNVSLITAGMSLDKIQDVVMQAQQNPNALPPMIIVAQLLKPTTAADIKTAIKGKEFIDLKAGTYTMYDGKDIGFCVVDNQTVVYGPPSQLKAVLERNAAPKLGEGMQRTAKELANAKTVALAVSLKELIAKPDTQAMLQNLGPQAKLVGDLEGVVLQIGMAQDIDVVLNVLMKTDKAADELRKMADGFLTLAKLGAGKDTPKEALELMDAFKLSSDGSTIKGTLAIKTATLAKLLETAAKKGGFPNQ